MKKHLGKQFLKFAAVLAIDHDMTEQETWYLIRDFAQHIIDHAENCDCEDDRADSKTASKKSAAKKTQSYSSPSRSRSGKSPARKTRK